MQVVRRLLKFVASASLWIVRVIASRAIIFIFMMGLLIASHTIGFVADLTLKALTSASRIVSSQPLTPKSRATLEVQNRQLKKQIATNNELISKRTKGIQSRARKTAVANVAASTGEALPFVGLAVIAGATAYEVKNSCDTMRDLYEIQVTINPSQANPDDRDTVCGLQVPTKEELWASVKSAPGAAWDNAVQTAEGTADWARSLERPDFSGIWNRLISTISAWIQ